MANFLEENGLLGWIDRSFEDSMAEICRMTKNAMDAREWCSNVEISSDDDNGDQCIREVRTLFFRLVDQSGIVICELPRMNQDGLFIIDGLFKAASVIELPMSDDSVISSYDDKTLSCMLRFPESNVPVKIELTTNFEFLMSHPLMRDSTKEDIQSVYLLGYLERAFPNHWRKYMNRFQRLSDGTELDTFIMSQTTKVKQMAKETNMDIIKEDKVFPGRTKNEILFTLCHMAYKCSKRSMDRASLPSKDNYCYKQLRTPGHSMVTVYRSCLQYALAKKTFSSFQQALRESIDKRILSTYRKGDIKIFGRSYPRIVMSVSARSRLDILSSVRKLVIPCDEKSTSIEPRQIHPSQYGFICPCETPEGPSAGLTKKLASGCVISRSTDFNAVLKDIIGLGTRGHLFISVNGVLMGATCQSMDEIVKIKNIYPTVSVWHNPVENGNVISIRCCQGRPLRYQNGKWIDPNEQMAMNAISMDHSLILGFSASMVPFPEHNHSARIVFASSIIKQAMESISVIESIKGEQNSYRQIYVQKPIVRTSIGRTTELDVTGLNLVVAILALTGYGQEDGIIVRKSLIERGAFSSYVQKVQSKSSKEAMHTIRSEVFCVEEGDDTSYYEISDVGAGPDELLSNSEIVMGRGCEKIMSTGLTSTDQAKHDVIYTNRLLRVTTKDYRNLSIGDKMSSRHAQKGVVCRILDDQDIPFTSDGIFPDLILNPHAIPSRMTIGQIIEGITGLKGAVEGSFKDGTPFELRDQLMDSTIVELTSGTTGELMGDAHLGIVYYMPLMHQSKDKIHMRWGGPRSISSRQPVSGKSRSGGLRIGEMETDCLLAHDANSLLRGISSESDLVQVPICNHCGTIITESLCPHCDEGPANKDISQARVVELPYSFITFYHIMAAMGIAIRSS